MSSLRLVFLSLTSFDFQLSIRKKGDEDEIWETSLSSAGGSDGLRCSFISHGFWLHGSYYSLAHLRELAKTTMDGTTALGLVKVAEEIGFETRAIKADMTLFDLPDLTFPFVAHVLKEGKFAPLLCGDWAGQEQHLYCRPRSWGEID